MFDAKEITLLSVTPPQRLLRVICPATWLLTFGGITLARANVSTLDEDFLRVDAC